MLVTRSQNYLRSEMSRVLQSMMAVWRLQVPEQKTSKNGKFTVKGIEDTGSSKADLTAPCARSFAKSAIRVKRLAIRSQNAGYHCHYSLDIRIRRLPVADTDAHGAAAAPGGAAKTGFSERLDCRDDFISAAVVSFFPSGLRLIRTPLIPGLPKPNPPVAGWVSTAKATAPII
jgi:hypothetical protein